MGCDNFCWGVLRGVMACEGDGAPVEGVTLEWGELANYEVVHVDLVANKTDR